MTDCRLVFPTASAALDHLTVHPETEDVLNCYRQLGLDDWGPLIRALPDASWSVYEPEADDGARDGDVLCRRLLALVLDAEIEPSQTCELWRSKDPHCGDHIVLSSLRYSGDLLVRLYLGDGGGGAGYNTWLVGHELSDWTQMRVLFPPPAP